MALKTMAGCGSDERGFADAGYVCVKGEISLLVSRLSPSTVRNHLLLVLRIKHKSLT